MKCILASLVTAAAALVPAGAASADPPPNLSPADVQFLQEMTAAGLTPESMNLPGGISEETRLGHAICNDLYENRISPETEQDIFLKDIPNLTPAGAQQFVSIAIAVYCPFDNPLPPRTGTGTGL